jgi:methionyl aminopeptidase
MHEDPQVPNWGKPNDGKRIKTGLVIAVEPMVNAGAPDVEVLDDNWTAVTKDRSQSAHFEHTIAVTEQGPWVLTDPQSSPGKR